MNYKKFVINLAHQAGKIIKDNFTLGMKKEWKTDHTPLTKADLAINRLVIRAVRRNFPQHNVLAEEGNYLSQPSDYLWVCDPIDGTIPFSHGIPTCVFSLALTYKGRSQLGVVYDPFMDRMFWAEKGKGATMNNKKISVSNKKSFKNSYIGMPVFYLLKYNTPVLLKDFSRLGAQTFNLASITYMGMLVASGELMATIYAGAKPHDTAALKVIVEEAGGKVTDLFGQEPLFDRDNNGYLVTNGKVHNQLVKLIEKNSKLKVKNEK